MSDPSQKQKFVNQMIFYRSQLTAENNSSFGQSYYHQNIEKVTLMLNTKSVNIHSDETQYPKIFFLKLKERTRNDCPRNF